MLQQFTDWLTYDLFHLAQQTKAAEAVNFFVYDSLKIILLLVIITHFMGVIRYFLPVRKLRELLANHKFFGLDYFFATIFGAITPFCSCSSTPLFIGFVEAGIPLGVTFAFLITSPLVNEVAVAMFVGLFGWKVTSVYVAAGIVIGMVGGAILGKLNMEQYVQDYVWKINHGKVANSQERKKLSWSAVRFISRGAWHTTKKISLYVLVGVVVGAIIHGYVPEGFFEKHISKDNPLAVPIAVIVAVPLYSNASGVIPIIQSLVAKGIPLGTALAFMMATVGLSLPEALILKRVMRLRLLLTFFGIVTIGMILIGYIFNLIF